MPVLGAAMFVMLGAPMVFWNTASFDSGSSKVVDINNFHQQVAGEDLSHYKCVTVYGHHDGFGASYGAIVTGLVYAYLHGMEFRHTPVQTLAHWVPAVDGECQW